MKLPAALATLVLGFCLAAPATAGVSVHELLLRKGGNDVNVRVGVSNPDSVTQAGPVTVTLWARPNHHSKWVMIKVWNDIPSIPAGNKISRDVFAQNSPELLAVSRDRHWEAKATAEAPGTPSSTKVASKGTLH